MEPHSEMGREQASRVPDDSIPLRDGAPIEPEGSDDDTTVVAALSDCYSALERSLTGRQEDGAQHEALDAVRVHIARLARAAYKNNLPPERVIIMLKRSLQDLWTTRLWFDTERDDLSLQLVEMMVTAYYAEDARKR